MNATPTGTTAAPFDWDAMLPAMDAPASTYNTGAKTDVRKGIPAPIRQRLEVSLGAAVAAIAKAVAAGKSENTVPPQWKLQAVTDATMGDALVKLMRKYGQYRPGEADWGEGLEFYVPGAPAGQITIRAAVVRYGTAEAVANDNKREPSKRAGVKLAPKDVAPGVYVRYAAKPLETRKPK